MQNHLVIYQTAMSEIVVIVTNQIGNLTLDNQYLVAEVDTDGNECPQFYGLMSYESALIRAKQSVDEIAILASAAIPDDLPF